MPIELVSPPQRPASLLSSIDEAERDRLAPLFERLSCLQGTRLATAAESGPYLWFPEGAVVSAVVRLGDGEAVEAALIGSEGVVGLEHVLGGAAPLTAMVQVPGAVARIPVDTIALDEFPSLRAALLRFAGSLLVTIAQVAACNATHSLRQRMARWLLMAHDRAGRDRFRLTHEFIASMINVRRAGVSQFASELREAGAIGYTRGEITVLDRKTLERESCECYGVIRRQSMVR